MDHPDASAMSIEAELNALLPPETHLYALLDLANVASEAPELHHSFARSSALCIFGDPSPEAQLASPWLIPIPAPTSNNRTCRRSIELAQRSSAVSWIASGLVASDLAKRLCARTEARLPDRYDVLLRHFDPRVLPVLHRVLVTPQQDAFFSLGLSWLYLDRAGSLTTISLTPAPVLDAFDAPIELDEGQAAALLDAAEIDAVMPELVKAEPERFLELGNGPARYRFTQHWLERARHWSLDQFPQKVVFCTLALRLGPAFDETPAWQQALGRVAKSGLRLSDAIGEALDPAPAERIGDDVD